MAQAAANSHRHGSTRQVADDMAWVTEDEIKLIDDYADTKVVLGIGIGIGLGLGLGWP